MPAVEQKPLAGIVRIDEFQCIADLVKTFFVEGVAGQLILPPISGCDVRAA